MRVRLAPPSQIGVVLLLRIFQRAIMVLLRVGQGLQQGLDLVLERFLRAVARFVLGFELPRELGLRLGEGVARGRRDLRRVPRPLVLEPPF